MMSVSKNLIPYIQVKGCFVSNMANIGVGRSKLSDLISNVRTGELQIPEFQRDYVWKKPDKLALIDSILHDHPIGTLLRLEVDPINLFFAWTAIHDTTPPESKIYSGIPLPDEKESPEYLLLDGQQRMTTLAHIFGGMGPRSWFLNTVSMQEEWKKKGSPSRLNDEDEWRSWLEEFEYSGYITDIKKKTDVGAQFGNKARRLSLELLTDRQRCDDVIEKQKTLLGEQKFSLKHTVDNYDPANHSEPKKHYKEKLDSTQADINFLSVLKDMITNVFEFNIPYVDVGKNMSVSGVCKIFTTINQTGQKLGAFDLTVASLYPKEIYLKKIFDDALNANPLTKIIDVEDKTWLLQTLALVRDKDPTSSKLPRTIKADMFDNDMFAKSAAAFEEVLEFLDTQFGTSIQHRGNRNISFRRALPVLASAQQSCSVLIGTPAEKLIKSDKFRTFYLAASISNRYSTSSGSLQSDDKKELIVWMNELTFENKMPLWLKNFDPQTFTDLHTNSRSAAVSKFLLGLFDSKDPKDIHNNKSVGFENTGDKIEVHHVFPKAYLKKQLPASMSDEQKENELKNTYRRDSILNAMLLTNETNNIVIKDQAPSIYLKALFDEVGETLVRNRLQRAFIGDEEVDMLLADNYDGFIQARAITIAEEINGIAKIPLFLTTVLEEE
jgi:hypothetical protein